MALLPCRECSAQVSTEAATCPQCGVPRPTSTPGSVQPTPAPTPAPGRVSSPLAASTPRNSGTADGAAYWLWSLAAVAFLGIMVAAAVSPKGPPSTDSSAAPADTLLTLPTDTAVALSDESGAKPTVDPAVRAARLAELGGRMRKKIDDVENITWYTPRGASDWNQFAVYAYVGDLGSSTSLRLFLATRTPSWVFWERVIFNVDGVPYEVEVEYLKKGSDVGYGILSEWSDMYADASLDRTLRAVAAGSRVKVRFQGRHYRKDVTLSEREIQRLRDAIEFYDLKSSSP